MLVLLIGLAYTQIVMHERYRTMSEGNRLKVVPLMAPRGTVFDRNGEAMVKDVLSFKVFIVYNQISDMDSMANVLSSVLEMPEEEIVSTIRKSRRQSYTPLLVADDIGIEKAIHIEEIGMDYPGLLLEVSAKREYLYSKSAANALGYLGLINRAEFERLKPYGYRINDLVGRSGIERYYDEYLRGKHGGKQLEVDHRGREASILGLKEPVPGKDVRLTLDARLQEYCDALLKDKRGAILVMDPDTGELLVMASAPSYDPKVFIDSTRNEERNALIKDEAKVYPLVNRAHAASYPPGSVFKVVGATAALETGAITPETTFNCPGYLALGRTRFKCWRKTGHGTLPLKEAIKHSCNVYFFRLGLLLGVEKIAEYAELFGFGSRTGIDLPGERRGTLPSRIWKKKRINDSWYKGDTVNYSIGQGYLLCSPLQLARMIAVFANGGYLVRPHLAMKVGDVDVNITSRDYLGISPENLQTVREGLRKVVNDPRGTGMKAKLGNIVVAGKTGTAQTAKRKSHGWFIGFAPYEDPQLVVVVFDEYGGKGGYYAAGTAGKVFKEAGRLGLLGK